MALPPAGDPDVAGATRTVERALELLEALADVDDGATLTELAHATGLSASTASRLLATLRLRHFVAREADGRFRTGPRLLQIAVSAIRDEPLYELAGPHLVALAQETQETANLAVALDDARILYVRQHSSPQFVRAATWTGRTIPRRGTALGAALDGRTGPGGFAVTHNSVEPDVTSIAAPVHSDAGVVGAMSVLAPVYRTPRSREQECGRLVADHARALSDTLGADARLGAEPVARVAR